MPFENIGVFLSFISYPYYKDGKEMYDNVFEPFFAQHKRHISKYDPDSIQNEDAYYCIYEPAGYRMFGSRGLAILSLVDDYSFYNRFFNKNHIHSSLTTEQDERKVVDLDFRSEVISGVYERKRSERTLLQIASDTFLQTANSKRFRFIGIIRLKIDYRLLVGKNHAVETVRETKNKIREIFDNCRKSDNRCDYFAIDCFDNDELTVVAFADDMLTLFNFLGNIRSIKNTDIDQEYIDSVSGKSIEKHLFGLTYLSFGYDLKFDWDKEMEVEGKINCTVETKPGHRDVFYKYLCDSAKLPEEKSLNISNLSVNISGGCTIYFTMPLGRIRLLEKLCKDQESAFRRDVRKIKVSLKDDFESSLREKSDISESSHIYTNESDHVEISRDGFLKVKNLMKQVGVSKMVRERLMALLEFYNLSCQNILQRFYLKELNPALSAFELMIREMNMQSKEDLKAIERMLNEEITNLEKACYDRLHIQKYNQAPLEYSGGIQQYLTSFDFVYKQICKLFSPKDDNAFYVTISGAERASSERMLFKLNIHDIIFPELFITIVWKEIANFALRIQCKNEVDKKDEPHKELIDTLNTWNDFISKEKSFRVIRDRIHLSENLLHDDEICNYIKSIVNPELIQYFINDQIVFHFAFNEDYSLMWHYYFKIMLQTTSCYSNVNHLEKKHFIYILLRLFMVANLAQKDAVDNFIKEHEEIPFDSLVGAQWIECYNKVKVAANEIFKVLTMYGFLEMVDYTVESYEGNVFEKDGQDGSFDPVNIQETLKEREYTIKEMAAYLKNGVLIQEDSDNSNKYSFLICLLSAFLRAVYDLDYTSETECPIKCVPRDRNGAINDVMLIKKDGKVNVYDQSIEVLVDTTGGFFIPSAKSRRQYFQLRTTLYRSLWNYRFMYQ